MMLLVAVVAISLVIAIARNQRRRRTLAAATVELEVDDTAVRRTLADGRRERVSWSALSEVEVLVVDSGPHAQHGAVLVLTGAAVDEGCLVPLPLAVEQGLVERLHDLPGFDGSAFLEALRTAAQHRRTCWSRVESASDRR